MRDGRKAISVLSFNYDFKDAFFLNMLLHRYFGSHAFETLKEAKLKTSRPREIKTLTSTVLEHFLPFDPGWVKMVDFGALCPIDKTLEVVNFLKANHPRVICRKADFHKTEYALEYKAI